MSKNKKGSVWAQEISHDELYQGVNSVESDEGILQSAYDAFSRFCQKEQRRNKIAKRKKHCWQ